MPMRTAIAALVLGAALAVGSGPGAADGNAGAYLAARQAAIESDYRKASEYFTKALVRDPSNIALMEGALSAFLAAGELERAAPIATRVIQSAPSSQIANLVLISRDARRGEWRQLLDNLDAGQSVGPLFDGLARAWALVGDGRMSEALAAFDEVAANPGVGTFGLYHKALALASVGDFESAADLFSGAAGPQIRLTRRGTIAYAEVLSQLDRGAEAVAVIEEVFGSQLDPTLSELRRQLAAGAPVPYTGIVKPVQGLAETAFSIAGALSGEAAPSYTLVYARVAEYLDPSHVDAVLLVAALLDDLGQFDLATDAFAAIPRDHPSYPVAELGRAEALKNSGRLDEAIAVLQNLSESHADLPVVHTTLGDMLRREERFDDASRAYDRAIALFDAETEAQWIVYFSRGITHEREDRWPLAEADFRKALDLRPDQPQVLNYLGYSLVELQTNLEEALNLIERAVAAQPDSGYIVDSLGWVLYRLGRYDEALVHMERAVELLPVDPVVNDHLGDVYWAVGRYREAEFQWHRALSFVGMGESNDADPKRMRRKLEVGLDVVLEEEGAPPLRVADDNG
jgi:tetratricopeptide (TPR) repeat protein